MPRCETSRRHGGLRKLFLMHNRIFELPAAVNTLTKLERLDLTSNPLEKLPADLSALSKLSRLELPQGALTDASVRGQIARLPPSGEVWFGNPVHRAVARGGQWC
jgi:hypothetical protein